MDTYISELESISIQKATKTFENDSDKNDDDNDTDKYGRNPRHTQPHSPQPARPASSILTTISTQQQEALIPFPIFIVSRHFYYSAAQQLNPREEFYPQQPALDHHRPPPRGHRRIILSPLPAGTWLPCFIIAHTAVGFSVQHSLFIISSLCLSIFIKFIVPTNRAFFRTFGDRRSSKTTAAVDTPEKKRPVCVDFGVYVRTCTAEVRTVAQPPRQGFSVQRYSLSSSSFIEFCQLSRAFLRTFGKGFIKAPSVVDPSLRMIHEVHQPRFEPQRNRQQV